VIASRVLQQTNKKKMAIKKSELYSSLWASCDELRGGRNSQPYAHHAVAHTASIVLPTRREPAEAL
jgi:hypothetical protein